MTPPSRTICAACFISRGCGFSGCGAKYWDIANGRRRTRPRSAEHDASKIELDSGPAVPDRNDGVGEIGEGSQFTTALERAVEVRAARRAETVFLRELREALVLVRSVAAGDHLDADAAAFLELHE